MTIVDIDTFGLTLGTDSPVALWALRTHDRLLSAAADANRDQRIQTKEALKVARRARGELQEELDAAEAKHDAAGGGTLRQIGLYIESETERRDERDNRRADLARDTVAVTNYLTGGLGSQEDYETLRQTATEFLGAVDTASDELQTRRDSLKQHEVRLCDRRRALREDRASYEGRTGRIPPWLDTLRRQVADAAGFAPEELPFLAELVDVADGQEQWRGAIETVLGANARRLLVPANRLEPFSRAIDPLRLSGRITFEGVPVAVWDPARAASAGLNNRIRLGRDYYVRADTVDYSVDPRVVGKFVDVAASAREVTVFCNGEVVARHVRSWAKHGVITDPAHQAIAVNLRKAFAAGRKQRVAADRQHADGHVVTLRALPDYDALFGVDFITPATKASST